MRRLRTPSERRAVERPIPDVASAVGDRRPSNASPQASPTLLDERARAARARATARLLALRHPSGAWMDNLDLCAFSGALYVLFTRLTGLIEAPGAAADEADVIRHMLNQVDDEGEFFKYPGSPSSRDVSILATLAFRLALGRLEDPEDPRSRFSANPEIDEALRLKLEIAIDRARNAKQGPGHRNATGISRADVRLTRTLLQACIEPVSLRPQPHLEPELVAWVYRSRMATAVVRHTSRLTRRMVPAHAILYRSAVCRSRRTRTPARSRKGGSGWRCMDSPAMRDLAHLIASWQNENGGWFFSSLFTMINAIALTQCGYTATDGVIGRAHRYVRSTFLPKPGAGAGIGFATPDVWDTTSGILAYLEQPGHRAADPEIRQSIDFLNAASAPDGGYGWGSGSSNDTDTDSTAYALRALALASATADERLRKALRSTLDGGLRYVTARQDRRGGFSVWHPCLVPAPSRAMGFRAQQVFDLATADTTARVLTGLAASGLTWKDRTVRRAVTDLVRLQHHNGGWWCRWCAGYIAGTSYVLEAMAEVGIRPDRSSDGADRERAAARRAVRRGIGFLVSRQNGDGGWGETVMADFSQRFAGVGASRALHTAYALLALIRCGDSVTSEPVVRGIEWLVAHQDERTGEWGGGDAVFTLFARTWYYRYPFYDLFMPLRALNAYLSPPE